MINTIQERKMVAAAVGDESEEEDKRIPEIRCDV